MFLSILVLAAYLPLSSFLFALKNDAFTGYLPPKFFMSESIHSGNLPLWNPYINYGIPQYGDMSSGFWSPVTWLVASTCGYNVYSYTIELLFYILLGGAGIYTLSGYWNIAQKVKFAAACAYICCGYNIGHLQHFNWISGAAFLPFCIWGYLTLFNNSGFKNSIRFVLILYLFISSAHPGLSIGLFYFLLATFIFKVFFEKNNSTKIVFRPLVKNHLLVVVLFLLVGAGMISGYADILPHFSRGEKLTLDNALLNNTTPASWISLLLPFASVKNNEFFNTDIAMRNCYISLLFLVFFISALFSKKSNWQRFFFITGLLFSLLAAGGIFKEFAFRFIPFTGYVRLNGEFRIFALLCFLVTAAIEFNKYVNNTISSKSFRLVTIVLGIISLLAGIIALIFIITGKQSIIYTIPLLQAQGGFAQWLKSVVDNITFYDALFIQGIIQSIFLFIMQKALLLKNIKLLGIIFLLDILCSSLLNIPYTGVGKTSASQVQAVLNKSPKGIPLPGNQNINQNTIISKEENEWIGDWSMFGKQPGNLKQVPYPITLKNTARYYTELEVNHNPGFTEKPLAFYSPVLVHSGYSLASPGTRSLCSISNFSPSKVTIQVSTDTTGWLVLQQANYPHWNYTSNSQKALTPVLRTGICFMAAPVSNEDKTFEFVFNPVFVKWMMVLSLVTFLLLSIIYLRLSIKASSLS